MQLRTQTLKQQIQETLEEAAAAAAVDEWADTAQHAASAAGLALQALIAAGDPGLTGFIEAALEALARRRGQLAGALFQAMRRERGGE